MATCAGTGSTGVLGEDTAYGVMGVAQGTGVVGQGSYCGVAGTTGTGIAGYFEATSGGYAGIFVGGNVGIGTKTPIEKLEVVGNVKISGNISINGARVLGDLLVNGGTLYVDSASDRVGIGTTAPGYKLDIAGETEVLGILHIGPQDSDLEGGEIRLKKALNETIVDDFCIDRFNDTLRFHHGGSEYWYVTKNGDVWQYGKLVFGFEVFGLNSWIGEDPDHPYALHISGGGYSPNRWVDIYDNLRVAYSVYAKNYYTHSSSVTINTEEELIEVINSEINKPDLEESKIKNLSWEEIEKYSKDLSKISIVSGSLAVKLYNRIKTLEKELEGIKSRLNILEGK